MSPNDNYVEVTNFFKFKRLNKKLHECQHDKKLIEELSIFLHTPHKCVVTYKKSNRLNINSLN